MNLKRSKAEVILKQNQKNRIWKRILSCLGAVVVFCTTYALILPAITLEREIQCGLQEHAHTADCYELIEVQSIPSLLCTNETCSVHQHAKDCYDEQNNLICGKMDYLIHTHNEQCYHEDLLICLLEERQVHHHTDECFEVIEVTETIHNHNETCYEQISVQVCENTDEHVHDETCEESSYFLVCASEDENHEHTDTCYESIQSVECGLHEHTEECFVNESILKCTLETEQIISSETNLICTEKMVIVHSHTEDCYAEGVLACGHPELLEHIHTEECLTYSDEIISQDVLTCTNTDESHVHSEMCYGQWNLICTQEEHVHTEECEMLVVDEEFYELEEYQQELVIYLQNLIDSLPTYDELDTNLLEYENKDDMEGYLAYYWEVYALVREAKTIYYGQTEEIQRLISSFDRLNDLQWIVESRTLGLTNEANVIIKQSNSYYHLGESVGGTMLLKGNGKTIDDMTYGNSMKYFEMAVVEEVNFTGMFKVTKRVTSGVDKISTKTPANDGFILLWHTDYAPSYDIKVGDYVFADYDTSTVYSYKAAGVGNVYVYRGTVDERKSVNQGLKPFKGVDTSEYITLNLYNYDKNINTKYRTNDEYPGFQESHGVKDNEQNSMNTSMSDFGDNVTVDYSANNLNVVSSTYKAKGLINSLVSTYTENGVTITPGLMNVPVFDAIEENLGADGYPALTQITTSASAKSLKWLFTENSSLGVTKVNTKNLTYLFQQDNQGAYWFNSRNNHAYYNAELDEFELYNELITPAFTVYPFGNFLPFNDINTGTTLLKNLTGNDLVDMRDSLWAKALKNENGLGEMYAIAGESMTLWMNKMDEKLGAGWRTSDTAEKATEEYFNASKEITGDYTIDFSIDYDSTQKKNNVLYGIDFDVQKDFFFGMEMEMEFFQPKNGLTGRDGQQKMVFQFAGDDDVWVFIDGKLFLDLTGVHRHVAGQIDFEKGEVYYYYLNPKDDGSIEHTPYRTVTFAEILGTTEGLNDKGAFEDYSQHSFQFYYMERGSGSSVCQMNFNLPVMRAHSISVRKEMTAEAEAVLSAVLGNPEFQFQILKAANGKYTEDLLIKEGVSYDVYDENGNLIDQRVTGANGIFTLKADEMAVFGELLENSGDYYVRELLDTEVYEQYGATVTVNGFSTTSNSYTNVTVGENTFSGVRSPIYDISEGNTVFGISNKINFTKTGSLMISKELETFRSTEGEVHNFDFAVTLDGSPLPAGTKYAITAADGTSKGNGTVAIKNGQSIVTIAAGESATISNILGGSKFNVVEVGDAVSNYVIEYSSTDADVTINPMTGASGFVKVTTPILVKVKNTENGENLEIPVSKVLVNPDGESHTYEFLLKQVKSAADYSEVTPAFQQTESVSIAEQGDKTASAVFKLSYVPSMLDHTKEITSFYYLISEKADSQDTATRYDDRQYLVEVQAKLNSVTKDVEIVSGTPKMWLIEQSGLSEVTEISFSNMLMTSLTIKKEISGNVPDTEQFSFTVQILDHAGNALMGTVPVQKTNADGTIASAPASLTFDSSGKAEITLCADELLQILEIPYGSTWTVTENAPGYHVSFRINEGNLLNGNAAQSTTPVGMEGDEVVFVNSTSYKLPETGGTGTHFYTLCGFILMMFSLLCVLKQRFEKRM